MDTTTRDTRTAIIHHYFEKPLLVAAVLSIPTTILQFSQVSEPLHTLGETLNWLIWLAFLAELAALLALTLNRVRYLLLNPIDLAIVALTPPFIGGAVQSIRALRLLRVFRPLRLAPLARVVFSLEGVRVTVGLALLTAIVGGAGFAAEEGISVGNGVYWAITTMTTVGYGDITPKTTEGKIIAVLVMLVGIGTATLVIGAVAQRFLATGRRTRRDRRGRPARAGAGDIGAAQQAGTSAARANAGRQPWLNTRPTDAAIQP